MTLQHKQSQRIQSIDILRGIVMLLMVLDHVRDYFHIGANTGDPLNLQTTYPLLFFTRWITHFCAPIFILLSGTSIYLQSQRKTSKEVGLFVCSRGCWLLVAEWTIIAFGWTFNPAFAFIPFQVIWAIGISMIILGGLLLMRLPISLLLLLGGIIVGGHNMLDSIEQTPGFQSNFWWDITHHARFTSYAIAENHSAILVYAFLPWTGIMILGYCLGVLFTPSYPSTKRTKILLQIGILGLVLFAGLRYSNSYGDPNPWSIQKDSLFTFFSFVNIQKYPPSLLYCCLTLSVALILLAFLEHIQNGFTRLLTVFGRTAFFYYIIHIYVIHLLAVVAFFVRGHSFAEATNTGSHFPFLFVVPGEGYSLGVVYIIWILILVALYPLCKRYDRYKQNHKEKWWLSYL